MSSRKSTRSLREAAAYPGYTAPPEMVKLDDLDDYYLKYGLRAVDCAWDPVMKQPVIFVIQAGEQSMTINDAHTGYGVAAGAMSDTGLRDETDGEVLFKTYPGTVAPDEGEAVMPHRIVRFWE